MTESKEAEQSGFRSRLAALLVADMVGYSSLLESNDQQAMEAIRELKDVLLEPVVRAYSGEVLKRMGDGWVFAFSSVADLCSCALEVQTKLIDHPVTKLRFGGHIGEIVEDKDDFYGVGVNLAQRLQTEAPPGGIMVSETLYQQLPTILQSQFRDAGNFNLKNITQPISAFQWRPAVSLDTGSDDEKANVNDVPIIFIEQFGYAPDETVVRAMSVDLKDQLITRLTQRTGIRIIDGDTQSSGKATYTLQGRLRVSGKKGRVNCKLQGSGKGTVFSRDYEGDISDAFQFSDDIVERIDSALRVQINAFDSERIAHLPNDALSISELKSRAAGLFYVGSLQSYETANELLEKAVILNSKDAMALAMRAFGVVSIAAARYAVLDQDQINSMASDLDVAVELAPRSDFIFSARARFKIWITADAKAALSDAQRACSLGPSYSSGYLSVGLAHLLDGQFELAAPQLEKAVALADVDPFVPYYLWFLAVCRHLMGEQVEAIANIDAALQLQPRRRCFHILKGLCYESMGDEAGAAESQKLACSMPNTPSMMTLRPPLPEQYQDFVNLFIPDSDHA